MDILDDMGVRKLSAKVFFKKVNFSFNLNFSCEAVNRVTESSQIS